MVRMYSNECLQLFLLSYFLNVWCGEEHSTCMCLQSYNIVVIMVILLLQWILTSPPQFVVRKLGRLMSLADCPNRCTAISINLCAKLLADDRVWQVKWWQINENSLYYTVCHLKLWYLPDYSGIFGRGLSQTRTKCNKPLYKGMTYDPSIIPTILWTSQRREPLYKEQIIWNYVVPNVFFIHRFHCSKICAAGSIIHVFLSSIEAASTHCSRIAFTCNKFTQWQIS